MIWLSKQKWKAWLNLINWNVNYPRNKGKGKCNKFEVKGMKVYRGTYLSLSPIIYAWQEEDEQFEHDNFKSKRLHWLQYNKVLG